MRHPLRIFGKKPEDPTRERIASVCCDERRLGRVNVHGLLTLGTRQREAQGNGEMIRNRVATRGLR